MARIERVGHTVLNVSDVDRAVAFYRDKLGMETVRHDQKNGRAFMSFGRQHHDIGLFRVRGEPTRGNLGLSHVAFVIAGGTEELKELHDDLVAKGVDVVDRTDYGYTRSVYFYDPDGNRLEMYCELLAPLASKRFLASRPGAGKAFESDDVLPNPEGSNPAFSAASAR